VGEKKKMQRHPIVLQPAQVEYCSRISHERDSRNRKAGVVDRQNSRRPPHDIMLDGVLGEYAFGCLMGRTDSEMRGLLDDTTPRGAISDVDQDLRLSKESTVDVKTTCFDRADLHIPPHKAVNPATFYVLMIRDTPLHGGHSVSFSYRGYVRGDVAMVPETIRRIPTRKNLPFHVIPRALLNTELPPEN
jgi:hypothetical protein